MGANCRTMAVEQQEREILKLVFIGTYSVTTAL